ncbi:hypothetical protein AB0I89_32160 [Micromonospora sp. NPDC049801]|uniref:hypothetical protein n=1 Tax=unclassified Micromonospora TaxID=2617518 RepID=UPI00340ADC68
MRAKIYNGNLRVDLLHTPEDLAKVVRVVSAAGLINMRISPEGEGPSVAVDVAIPDGWATHVGAALLSLAAAFGEPSPEVALARWQERVPEFAAAAEQLKHTES